MDNRVDSKAASTDLMEELHCLLTEDMIKLLRDAIEAGEPLQAAQWSSIRQFLRDNNIEAARGRMAKLSSLADEAPTFDANEGTG